jgi:hypothetical protein
MASSTCPANTAQAADQPPHKVEVATGEPGNPHVYTDQNRPGRPDHHTVNYDISDHRDSPTFARITLTGATE